MKLTVGDIKFSASGPVNVFATVGVEPDQLPFPVCAMDVTVPLVEGKALEQYKDDLLKVARERIAEIYKEIVCGGELDEEIIITICGKLFGKFNIRVVNKNGKLSVAGPVGEASDMLDYLDGKIEPSELGREMLEQIKNNHSNNDLEGRVAALEKRIEEIKSYTSEKVTRFYNTDGTIRVEITGIPGQEKRPEKTEAQKLDELKDFILSWAARLNRPGLS
ncbi:hypothetical protein RH437_004494 [Salmonella enterica]|nr:hypothetical protein [Salmonella enterica subsp. diarizonae]ELB6473070.1 hypothetical protein [Salmonella enterica]ELI2367719.1 hypothetical protein [Salmonella enterica]HAB1616854.1 hypothetical protein [Salmonella enterica subsp. diarizonae]